MNFFINMISQFSVSYILCIFTHKKNRSKTVTKNYLQAYCDLLMSQPTTQQGSTNGSWRFDSDDIVGFESFVAPIGLDLMRIL